MTEIKLLGIVNEIPELDSPDIRSKATPRNSKFPKIFSEPSSPVSPALRMERKATRQLDPAIVKIRQILLRDKRTPEEGMYLYHKMKQFTFFQNFAQKHAETINVSHALSALCRLMRLETYPPDTPIFKIGDSSKNTFMIVLTGEVHIYKNNNFKSTEKGFAFKKSKTTIFDDNQDQQPRESTFRRQAKRNTTILRSGDLGSGKKFSASIDFESTTSSPFEMSKFFKDEQKYVDTIHRGGTLGPNDIEDYEELRDMSAYTGDMNCDIISISTDDYEYLKVRYAKTNSHLLNFLIDNVPELDKSLRYSHIKNIETLFWEENFQLHNYVNVEGTKGKTIYLIYEGSCEISKNIKVHTKETLARGGKISREVSICILSSGALVGEEILYNEDGLYEYNVKVTSSKAKLLAIDKEIFCTKFPFLVQKGVKQFSKIRREQNQSILASKQENIKNLLPILEFAQSPKNINSLNDSRFLNLLPEFKSPAHHKQKSDATKVLITKSTELKFSENPIIKNFSRKLVLESYNNEETLKKLMKSPSKGQIPGKNEDKLSIDNYKFDFGFDDKRKKTVDLKALQSKYRNFNKENYTKHLTKIRACMSPSVREPSSLHDIFNSNNSKSPNLDWTHACPIAIQAFDCGSPKSSATPSLPILSARSKISCKLDAVSTISGDDSIIEEKGISNHLSPRLRKVHKKHNSIKVSTFNEENIDMKNFISNLSSPVRLNERPGMKLRVLNEQRN